MYTVFKTCLRMLYHQMVKLTVISSLNYAYIKRTLGTLFAITNISKTGLSFPDIKDRKHDTNSKMF
jgi:hypothetical protein